MIKLLTPFLLLVFSFQANSLEADFFCSTSENINFTKIEEATSIISKNKIWRLKSDFKVSKGYRILTVGFLDGSEKMHQDVINIANQWSVSKQKDKTKGAYILFEKAKPKDINKALIRVTFKTKLNQSRIGNSSKTGFLTKKGASMHLASANPIQGTKSIPKSSYPVILHEFGHALGLEHEHKHPKLGILWNKKALYKKYYTNGWTGCLKKSGIRISEKLCRKKVDQQIITPLRKTKSIIFTESSDEKSIMMYPISKDVNCPLDIDYKKIRENKDSDCPDRFGTTIQSATYMSSRELQFIQKYYTKING